MNISRNTATELENILNACYTDGGDPYCLTQHVMRSLDITIEGKRPNWNRNWEDHVPEKRVYEREQIRP